MEMTRCFINESGRIIVYIPGTNPFDWKTNPGEGLVVGFVEHDRPIRPHMRIERMIGNPLLWKAIE